MRMNAENIFLKWISFHLVSLTLYSDSKVASAAVSCSVSGSILNESFSDWKQGAWTMGSVHS